MKVAIAFWGIQRYLKFTYDSIKTNILNPIHEGNIEYDIYMHTYSLTSYVNKRANEKVSSITEIDNDQYIILNCKQINIEPQDDVTKEINMLQYRTHLDPWCSNYNSVDNFILAQYSKQKVTNLIRNSGIHYDYVIFVRPDCKYITKFDIRFLEFANDNTIVIPNFHLCGPFKFNDRFCVANPQTFHAYGDIFTHLKDISKREPLHSETVIGRLLTSKSIKFKYVHFPFRRVRHNNVVVDTDVK